MNTATIDGALFANMIRGGAACLSANRKIVNDLNVFPIPDGDTGDNMFMTIDSGAESPRKARTSSIGEVSGLVASGMLRGARGNSGVILSRIFAGISKGLTGIDSAGVDDFGKAFLLGVEESYRAVKVPVEGTILTVFRDAVNFANARIAGGTTFEQYFDDFNGELRRSLDRTPELLAVLKEAGVVDSGGAGLVYIAEGMQQALEGKEISYDHGGSSPASGPDLDSFTEDSVLEYGYCTEFLLRLQNAKTDLAAFDIDAFSDWLNAAGESVVAFRDGSVVKVHVHTKTPGQILNYCQQFGEFLTLKIENMTIQHNETSIQNRFEPARKGPHKKYGLVAVAAGQGLKNLFTELGCDRVVDGGQSMNPSAAELLHAFEEVNADTVFVFPNNGNIILTANQAAEMYNQGDVRVIPTKTIGEGYAAVSQFDAEEADPDLLQASLEEIAGSVVTGMVSQASRDTEKDGISLKKGDYIGFSDGRILTDAAGSAEAVTELFRKLNGSSYDVALLLSGCQVAPEDGEALAAALQKLCKTTEVIPVRGDQPVYDYVLILE